MRSLLNKLALAMLGLLVCAGTSRAATITVDYYTTGVFCATLAGCATSTDTIVYDGASYLSFTGAGSSGSPISISNSDSGSVNQPLGQFTVHLDGTANQDLPTDFFQLTIFQSQPSLGSGLLTGTITGKFKGSGVLDFGSTTSIAIGDVTYALVASTLNLQTTNNGTTPYSLLGDIRHVDSTEPNVVPEPASMLLVGGGLAGLVARRYRRRRA